MSETLTGPLVLAPIVQGQPLRFGLRRIFANGAPTDFTGAQVAAHIRVDWDKPKIAQFRIDLTDAANGRIGLNLTAADTLAIAPGSYKFDVHFVMDGERDVLTVGQLTISGAQTRDV